MEYPLPPATHSCVPAYAPPLGEFQTAHPLHASLTHRTIHALCAAPEKPPSRIPARSPLCLPLTKSPPLPRAKRCVPAAYPSLHWLLPFPVQKLRTAHS